MLVCFGEQIFCFENALLEEEGVSRAVRLNSSNEKFEMDSSTLISVGKLVNHCNVLITFFCTFVL